MASQTISVSEAALLVKKSAQTIRRLIKGNMIKYRRKHTPQGFSYHIERQSLLDYFFSPEDKRITPVRLPGVSRPVKKKPKEIKITPEEDNGVYDLDFKESVEAREEVVAEPFYEPLEEKKEGTIDELEPLPQEEVVISKKGASRQADVKSKKGGPSSQQASQAQTAQDNTKFILDYFNDTLQQIVKQHERIIHQYEEDKRNLFNLVETFQQRIVNLEHHIRQLEAPKKNWWQFWK